MESGALSAPAKSRIALRYIRATSLAKRTNETKLYLLFVAEVRL
jgi:hypothetical protein